MKSKTEQFYFSPFTKMLRKEMVSLRAGETRLGEKIAIFENAESFKGKYLVLGISEDIGPQANGGLGGAGYAFDAFIKRFVNMQSNEFLHGSQCCVLGNINQKYEFKDKKHGRELVEELDNFVIEILTPYVERGLVPIVIGGGHNNAYPILRTMSTVLQQPLNVINCDPHADFRQLEGRHSGNPFSYAFYEGFIEKYAVLGLHQSYNSQFILEELRKHKFPHTFFDDYVLGKTSFLEDMTRFASLINTTKYGVELDLDSIAHMPSSAFTPSGLKLEEARAYIQKMAASENACYLHLPEGAPRTPQEEAVVGKALAYLVTDFIKIHEDQ